MTTADVPETSTGRDERSELRTEVSDTSVRSSAVEIRHGIDLVYVPRLREIMESNPAFEEGVFTKRERAYCRSRPDPYPHFAARFAAKEAVLKALHRGLSTEGPDEALLGIEVVRRDGPPYLQFGEKVRRWIKRAMVSEPVLSISHAGDYAMASVAWTAKVGR